MKTNNPLIQEILDESKEILTWEDDWDGEGSSVPKQETWDRMNNYISNLLGIWPNSEPFEDYPPRISIGPNDSFDVYVSMPDKYMLVNIPEVGQDIDCYGCNTKTKEEFRYKSKDLTKWNPFHWIYFGYKENGDNDMGLD